MGVIKKFKENLIKTKTKPAPVHDDDEDFPRDYDRGKTRLIDRILLNRAFKFFVVIFIGAVILPITLYVLFFEDQTAGDPAIATCLVKDEYRVPCFPGETNITSDMCSNAGCCFNSTTSECHHYLPSNYGFTIQDWTTITAALNSLMNTGLTLTPKMTDTVFGSPSAASVQFTFDIKDPSHLVFSFSQSSSVKNDNSNNVNLENTLFNLTLYGPDFYFDINRRMSNGSNISPLMLSTSRGPLIFSEEYAEITFDFSSSSILYGLGGLNPVIKKGSPQTLYNGQNRTGSHPVIISVDEYGYFQGFFINNTGPMEIELYDKSNLMIVRFVLTEKYDVHLFAGPTPQDVMDQLTNVIGKPMLPPYWALGFHVCPDLSDDDVCKKFETFMEDSLAYEVPWDSHCLDNSMILNRVLSGTGRLCVNGTSMWEDDNLTSRKIILTLPVPVLYNDSGIDGEFIKMANGSEYLGKYQLKSVYYPDFFDDSSNVWLYDQLSFLISDIPDASIGGYVLLNNWPEEDPDEERQLEIFDYIPQGVNDSLSNNTVWWDARHIGNITHLSVHNMYGNKHTERVVSNIPPDNIVLSTASYPGLGALGGCHAHPNSEIEASWTALQQAYNYMFGLSLSGIALAGSPVCGNDKNFNYETHRELCLRWYQLAALSPFMRVSSPPNLRDPVSFPNSTLFSAKFAVELRYKLLPYLYVLYQEANQTGMPVVRPMSFVFPEDSGTWNQKSQYMLGPSLLVAPALESGVVSLSVYLPEGDGTWYHLEGGTAVSNGTGGVSVTLAVTQTQPITLLRPGFLVLLHDGGLSTSEALEGNYTLTVGLLCDPEAGNCSSAGDISLPNITLTSLNVIADNKTLQLNNVGTVVRVITLNTLYVYGLDISYEDFTFPVAVGALPSCPNHLNLEAEYEYETNVMWLTGLDLSTCTGTIDSLVLTW